MKTRSTSTYSTNTRTSRAQFSPLIPRRTRAFPPTATFLSRPWATTLLDRLQTPLTRYRD